MVKIQKNLQVVKNLFYSELERTGYSGVLGVAGFKEVYHELMPVQRKRLRELSHGQFQNYVKNGSVISLGIAYPEYAIDCINLEFDDGGIDKNSWNTYAKEYRKLNRILNNISQNLSLFMKI